MVRKTVLAVEDEPDMLEIIRVNLEQAGYNVVPAADGVQAYNALEGSKPDLVVLDLSMPNMSGFRFARLVRRDARWEKLPLIVVTAFAFEEVEDLANEKIDGFITKPFDPADLVSKVEYVLSRNEV
ncbi:MAG TPA: response regulator [Chloroflexota bacterium]|nr:response regulator [Chloroflexota bacterium]